MSVFEAVSSQVHKWCSPYMAEPYVVVPTFNMYPSNSCVNVFIEGGADTFIVSDGGGALDIASGLGLGRLDIKRQLARVARSASLNVSKSGWIYQAGVTTNTLTSIIALVADCSREAAHACSRAFSPNIPLDFRKDLDYFLANRFKGMLERDPRFLGASNTNHKYDYAIKIEGDIKIVVDAVTPDANSINSAIVSHIDLKNANRPDLAQRIVYDDRVEWKSSDLILLGVGATPVAFSSAERNLIRLRSRL